MARTKMLNVELERDWSGNKAGDIVTVEDFTAESMVKKGYGRITKTIEKKKEKVETSTAQLPPENMMAGPEVKEKPKPPENVKKGGAD